MSVPLAEPLLGRFEIKRGIGSGSVGTVLLAHDLQTGEDVAVKYNRQPQHKDVIQDEANTYTKIALDESLMGVTFPNLIWHGDVSAGTYMLVWQELGPTLSDLKQFCGHKLSRNTVCQLGQQIVQRLQCLHEKGYAHGSVKPLNICMGCGKAGHDVFLIDYGATSISNTRTPRTSSMWQSINRLHGCEHGPRDDLESMIYTLFDLLGDTMPRDCHRDPQKKMLYGDAMAEKHGLTTLWVHVRNLCFGEPPDYNAIIQSHLVVKDTKPFDWVLLYKK